jgi:DNA-directed RNA polymerase subunit RPC12/RpoP
MANRFLILVGIANDPAYWRSNFSFWPMPHCLLHTRAANRLGREQNREANGGEMRCPDCDKRMNEPVQSKRGEEIDRDAAVGDHIKPKPQGGDGATVKDMKNHETKCWECNSRKSDK